LATIEQVTGLLHYVRHFGLLVFAVALLASTGPIPGQGPVLTFGVYGAVHASTVVFSLRAKQSHGRKLCFVMLAACLSMMCVRVALQSHSFFVAGGPQLSLALGSGLGAITYGLLVRWFWIDNLQGVATALIGLGCVGATYAVSTGLPTPQAAAGVWLAAVWWLAFSTGLCIHDHVRHP
jgi:hypothetical protein